MTSSRIPCWRKGNQRTGRGDPDNALRKLYVQRGGVSEGAESGGDNGSKKGTTTRGRNWDRFLGRKPEGRGAKNGLGNATAAVKRGEGD